MLQVAMSNRGGADDKRAVGHRIRNGRVFLCAGQDRSAAHGGTRLAKGAFKRIYNPQVRAAEIAHRAGCRADVERIARRNEHDAQAIEFAR